MTRYDSMNLAKEMMYSQRLPEAINILTILDKKYPDEENVQYLYSLALYWNKDYNNTLAYIRSTAKPTRGLNLHYGKILFELNRLNEAQRFLSAYLKSHEYDAEALLLLAKISYWQGGPTNKSLEFINRVLTNDPLHSEALQLKEELILNTAPQLIVNASYYQDSQPIQAMMYATRLSFYHNSWFQPAVQLNTNHYAGGEQAVLASFSNRMTFPNTKTELELISGIFSNNWSSEVVPTWSLGIKQKTLDNLFISADIGKAPYLYTLASIGQNVMPLSIATSITKESNVGWTGNMTLQKWTFIDENQIRSLSSWVLVPIVKHPVLTLNIGYAFMMAHADHNRFTLEKPAVQPMRFEEVLPGVFDPYFTPQNQRVHAALAKVDINFSKKIRASLNSNIGVHATIDNPNFINYGAPAPMVPITGNGPASRPNPTPKTFESENIHLVLIPTTYLPIDIKGRLAMDLGRCFTLHTEWSYLSTIYFKSQTVNVGFNWKLAKS